VRKTVQYILLFLFIWQIVGFVTYFEISHFKLKKEIKLLLKQGVPEDELVYFDFTDDEMNDLIWLKKNEFNLNGNLFDVVRKSKDKNGVNHLECISDKKETILFARLNQTISQNLGDDKSQTPISNWMKLLKVPNHLPQNDLRIEFIEIQSNDFESIPYLNQYSFELKRIPSPPPQTS
jgi:hypothetical protein